MRGIKTKASGKWKRLAIFLTLTFVLVFLLNSVSKVYRKKQNAEEALARMQGEVKTLEERENFLKESLARLGTEEGLKFEIRKKLNVAEVGESVAIIVSEEEASSTKLLEPSLWQKIKTFVSDLFE